VMQHRGDEYTRECVTSFVVEVSGEGSYFHEVQQYHSGCAKAYYRLRNEVAVRYVRIRVKSWQEHISLRAAVLVTNADWACSIKIRVEVTSEAIKSATRYLHSYKRSVDFKKTYSSVKASVKASASGSGYGFSGGASLEGALAVVNQDTTKTENEASENTGETVDYRDGSHQIWRYTYTTVNIDNQPLTDVQRTWVEAPTENWSYEQRIDLAKKYLRDYYGADGSKPTMLYTFSVSSPY